MKKRISLTITLWLFLMLGACSMQEAADLDNNNHGYGWDYDIMGHTGTRVDYNIQLIGITMEESFGVIESKYIQTEQCVGITAPGPLIVIVPEGQVEGGVAGRQYNDTGLIVIDRGQSVFEHEFVHYLLWASGFSNDRNREHDSPLFDACAAGQSAAGQSK